MRTASTNLRRESATTTHKPGFWARPWGCAAPLCQTLRAVIFLSLFCSRGTSAIAQVNLPPALEERIAAGVEALKSGDLVSAEEAFSVALRQGAKHPLIYHNLGVIAVLRGNHSEAVTRFRQALALQPDYGSSRLLLGSSLLALRKNAEAVRELKRAAALLPDQPQAHFELGRAFEASGNWIAAVQEFQKLVQLAPQEPEYSYQLCNAWIKLSDWSSRQIIKLNPDSGRLFQGLAMEYAAQKKYDQALVAYKQAARSDPKMPEIHLAMALIRLERKEFDEALSEIALELELVPESKSAAEAKATIQATKAALSN
jgi:tetratricopeptide (TPR) repeat protein